MGSFFSASSENFSDAGSFRFNHDEADLLIPRSYTGEFRDSIRSELMKIPFSVSISGPTIVGSKNDTIRIAFSGGTVKMNYHGVTDTIGLNPVVLSTGVTGFLDSLKFLPMGAFQLSAGTLFGTVFSFRFLPTSDVNGRLGNTSFVGFGIQHNPMIWFDNSIPINFSLAFFAQTLKVGTVFRSAATDFGAFVSKRFGPGLANITPFAGVSFESSKMNISYDFQTTDFRNRAISIPVSFSLRGENTLRLTLGLSVKILVFDISGEFNVAKYDSTSIGVGLIIRARGWGLRTYCLLAFPQSFAYGAYRTDNPYSPCTIQYPDRPRNS